MVEFTQPLFDEICERITEGKSLRDICADPDMPSRWSFYRWLNGSAELSDQYARAKEEQADTLADEIVAIADEAKLEDVQAARLRIDARKWYAGKLRPKKYGDKTALEHSGPDGGAIPVTNVTYEIYDPKRLED